MNEPLGASTFSPGITGSRCAPGGPLFGIPRLSPWLSVTSGALLL